MNKDLVDSNKSLIQAFKMNIRGILSQEKPQGSIHLQDPLQYGVPFVPPRIELSNWSFISLILHWFCKRICNQMVIMVTSTHYSLRSWSGKAKLTKKKQINCWYTFETILWGPLQCLFSREHLVRSNHETWPLHRLKSTFFLFFQD